MVLNYDKGFLKAFKIEIILNNHTMLVLSTSKNIIYGVN